MERQTTLSGTDKDAGDKENICVTHTHTLTHTHTHTHTHSHTHTHTVSSPVLKHCESLFVTDYTLTYTELRHIFGMRRAEHSQPLCSSVCVCDRVREVCLCVCVCV